MNKTLLHTIVNDQHEQLENRALGVERVALPELQKKLKPGWAIIITGIRRCGKSTLLRQLAHRVGLPNVYYFNFEDERLAAFRTEDFQSLLEIFYERSAKAPVFMFDEIQAIPYWERFVRRLQEEGALIVVTGSNASLLSKELGTLLTGRHLDMELFPFSFAEYLDYYGIDHADPRGWTTRQLSGVVKQFQNYLTGGGFPLYVQSGDDQVLTQLYEDILYRDIARRYRLGNFTTFRELALYLFSNLGSPVVYNKLKSYFTLGSVNTVAKYIGFLESTYLAFVINQFSASIKKQRYAPKKVYAIDNGLASKIGFHLSENRGLLLENLVFNSLRRQKISSYYYKTNSGYEVDFLTLKNDAPKLIQVTTSLKDPKVHERELRAITQAMAELRIGQGLILTEAETDTIEVESKRKVEVKPIYKWLLELDN